MTIMDIHHATQNWTLYIEYGVEKTITFHFGLFQLP